jgi:hypothetical protein
MISFIKIRLIIGILLIPLAINLMITNISKTYPLSLMLLGVILNAIVVFSNGGRMPVYTRYLKRRKSIPDKSHFFFDNPEEMKYFYLADIFYIILPSKQENKKLNVLCISLGDVLVVIGFILQLNMLFLI